MWKAKDYRFFRELLIKSNDAELMSMKFKIDDEIHRREEKNNRIRELLPKIR